MSDQPAPRQTPYERDLERFAHQQQRYAAEMERLAKAESKHDDEVRWLLWRAGRANLPAAAFYPY